MRITALFLFILYSCSSGSYAQDSLFAMRGQEGELDELALALSAEIVYSETKLLRRERIYRIAESSAFMLERAAADRVFFYSYQGSECWLRDCSSGPIAFSVYGDDTLSDAELQMRVESLGGTLVGQMQLQLQLVVHTPWLQKLMIPFGQAEEIEVVKLEITII